MNFDVWHDRATFHFLTKSEEIEKYLETARNTNFILVRNSVTGFLAIGTFSADGPKKCSRLEIKQYNEEALTSALKNGFEKIKCLSEDHLTTFDTKQNFLFCSFKRKVN